MGNTLYHRAPTPETLDIIAIKRINIQTLLHNLHIRLCSSGHLHEASRLKSERMLHAGIHRTSIPQQQPMSHTACFGRE